MNNLELLLSLYDAHTIVEHFFPSEDREKFHRDYRNYQRSFWRQLLRKEPFYSYETKRKLSYHKWGDYKVVLDRIARERNTQLEKLSRIVKKEVERRRGRNISYIDYDDISLLDIAFLLLLLNALNSNDADAKLDLIERADTPEKALEEMEKAGAPQDNDNDNHDNHDRRTDTDRTDTTDDTGDTTDTRQDDIHRHDSNDGDYSNFDDHDRHSNGRSYDDSNDDSNNDSNDDGYRDSYDSWGDWGGGDW